MPITSLCKLESEKRKKIQIFMKIFNPRISGKSTPQRRTGHIGAPHGCAARWGKAERTWRVSPNTWRASHRRFRDDVGGPRIPGAFRTPHPYGPDTRPARRTVEFPKIYPQKRCRGQTRSAHTPHHRISSRQIPSAWRIYLTSRLLTGVHRFERPPILRCHSFPLSKERGCSGFRERHCHRD